MIAQNFEYETPTTLTAALAQGGCVITDVGLQPQSHLITTDTVNRK